MGALAASHSVGFAAAPGYARLSGRRGAVEIDDRQTHDAIEPPRRLTPPQLAGAAVGMAALAALMVVIALVLSRQTASGGPGVIVVGRPIEVDPRPAPDFVVTAFDGRRVQLSEFRGRIVVLNFWASWCPPCRVEAPVLQRAAQRLESSGVAVLGIDVWDDLDAARAFLADHGITYANAVDETRLIPVEYGVTGLPETYVIDRHGVLVRRWIGPLTDAQIDALLAPVLGNERSDGRDVQDEDRSRGRGQ